MALSIVNVILLIIITFSSVCLSFAKNENRSVATIRHVIINPLQALFFSRTTFSTFNAILEVKDLRKLYCYILVIGSFFIFLFFLIEEHYINSDEIERTFYLNASLVFFVSCFFLLIGSIFKKKNVYGLFGGFIVTSIVGVFAVLSITKSFKKISLKEQTMKCSDNTLYLQLHLILHSIKDRNIKREEMMKFIKFNEFSINEDDSFWNEQKKEYSLLLKVESMFKKILNNRPNSLILRIGMYKLLYYYLQKYKGAYILIYHLYEDICEGIINASIGEKFYVFRTKKVLEEKGFESAIDKTEISTRYQINKFIDKIAKTAESYYSFWTLLLNASQSKDIKKLNEMGYEIGKLVTDIKYQFNRITTMKLKDKKIYGLYGYYLKDILNEPLNDDIDEVLKGISDNLTGVFNGINLNDIHTASNFHFILVSAKPQKFGIIEKISPEISKILRYESSELIGKKLDIIMPNFLIKEHKKYIKQYFELNSNSSYNFFKKRPFTLKSKELFLETIYLNITIHSDEDSFPFIFAQVDEEEQLNVHKNNSNTCYVLTDKYFIFKNFTSNSIQLLQLETNVLDDFTEITPYIKEFNEDIHTHIAANNFDNTLIDINSIKLNIIRNNFIDFDEQRIITWSINNQYFKLHVNEISFNKNLIGYKFIFIKTNSKNQRSSVLHQGRNSIMSIISNKNDENVEKINNEFIDLVQTSYVPNNKEKFQYDINKKEFIFLNEKNKKKIEENYEEIEEYFQKNYLEILKKITNEEEEELEENEDEEFEEEEENEENKNFNKSNSFFDDDKEEILKKSTKRSNLNNSSIKNSNSNPIYYNVNLQHITFFIYNFKTFVVNECKGYINESKVEEIFRNERILTSAVNQTHTFGKKDFKTDKNNDKNNEKKDENQKDQKKKVKKSHKNQTLSKNILELGGIILLNFLGFVVIVIIMFYRILESHSGINNLINIQNSFSDLMENANNAFYISFQSIVLQKSLYYNYNPLKSDLENTYKNSLKDIYNNVVNLLKIILGFYSSMKPSNKYKVDNYMVTYCSLTTTNYYRNCTKGYLFNLLEEFAFSIFSLYCTNNSELNFTNQHYNFIFINYEYLLLDKLIDFEQIFIDEYHYRVKNLEHLIIIIIIVLIVFQILIILGFIKVNININKEEDRIFEIFFKINPQYIINAITKCEKFIELNHVMQSDPNNLVSNPVINVLKQSSEEETNIDNETSSLITFDVNQIQKNWEKNPNKIKLINNKKLDYSFIKKMLFLFLSVLAGLILINQYTKGHYDTLSVYINLYLVILFEQTYFVKFFNYYRSYLIYSYYRFKDEKVNQIYISLHEELTNGFEINEQYYIQIMTYANSLNENGQNLIKNYYNDQLCEFFADYGKTWNKECKEVADNIANFGLWFAFNHEIQLLIYLVKKVDQLIEIGESKGYYYDEILYDSGIVNPLYPQNENLYEDYLKYNPFDMINSNSTLNLTVLIENVVKPSIDGLRKDITFEMKNLCDLVEEYSLILCIWSIIILSVNYIVFFIPKIIKTNSQIKQGKTMLKIIPKEERDKIKKTLKKKKSE